MSVHLNIEYTFISGMYNLRLHKQYEESINEKIQDGQRAFLVTEVEAGMYLLDLTRSHQDIVITFIDPEGTDTRPKFISADGTGTTDKFYHITSGKTSEERDTAATMLSKDDICFVTPPRIGETDTENNLRRRVFNNLCRRAAKDHREKKMTGHVDYYIQKYVLEHVVDI